MDILNMEKQVNLPAQLLKIEAMLEVSLRLQAQIIANQEEKDFTKLVSKVFEDVDKTSKEIFQNLSDIK
jgi:hypothetical protein